MILENTSVYFFSWIFHVLCIFPEEYKTTFYPRIFEKQLKLFFEIKIKINDHASIITESFLVVWVIVL